MADGYVNPPITQGVDFNRFLVATVSTPGFETEATMTLFIRGPSLHFYIKNTGDDTVEYSFNGNTVHGRLLANTERFCPLRRVSKIWFRCATFTTVEVEAWATA